jgi:hypothetical protein
MRQFAKQTAIICLLLILASAVAVVAHHHPNDVEERQCTVCAVAHAAVPVLASPALCALLLTVLLLIAQPAPLARQRLLVFARAVRPPPPSL